MSPLGNAETREGHEGAGCWCLASEQPFYECERAAHVPCPWCNDEGIVCDLAGEIIGPCKCSE